MGLRIGVGRVVDYAGRLLEVEGRSFGNDCLSVYSVLAAFPGTIWSLVGWKSFRGGDHILVVVVSLSPGSLLLFRRHL